MQTQTDSKNTNIDPATIAVVDGTADTATLLSVDEYHLLVKKLADRVERLEHANAKLTTDRDTARRKLKVQHRLIHHLRTRLDVVTGLEIPVDGEQAILPVRKRHKESRSATLGRAVMRFRADKPAIVAEPVAEENIPAIDPAEFLPIDDSMFDSLWVRRVREVGRRCRAFASACSMALEQHVHGVSHRART